MVVRRYFFKGKIRYWIVLLFALFLFLVPTYFAATEPESFISDEFSLLTGKPTVNCTADETMWREDGVFIKRDGNKCLVENIPNRSWFSVNHPILYTLSIKWGWVIGLVLIGMCYLPNKEHERQKKERQAGKGSRSSKKKSRAKRSKAQNEDRSR